MWYLEGPAKTQLMIIGSPNVWLVELHDGRYPSLGVEELCHWKGNEDVNVTEPKRAFPAV